MTSGNARKNVSFRGVIGISLSVLLTLVFIYIAFAGVNLSEVWEVISGASPLWILLFLLSSVISHFIRALRWGVIMDSIKPGIGPYNLFSSLMIGYGVNNVVPRLGELTRAVSLGELEKVSRTSVVGTIVVERVLDIVFFGLAVIVSAALYSGDIYYRVPWLKSTIVIGTLVVSVVVFGIVFAVIKRKSVEEYAAGHAGEKKFKAKFLTILVKLIHGFASLQGAKNYGLVILYSALIMIFYALTSYLAFFTLSMEQYIPVNYLAGWVIMSVSSIGIMIPTPGGIGSYHAITKTALVELYGFDAEISVAYATLSHGLAFILQIGTALLFFFLLKKKYSFFNRKMFQSLEEEKPDA